MSRFYPRDLLGMGLVGGGRGAHLVLILEIEGMGTDEISQSIR